MAEGWARNNLILRGYTCFVPTRCVLRHHTRIVTLPLFVGYGFVALADDDPWIPIQYTPGVRSLLRHGSRPALCPPGAVEALQASEYLRATPLPAHRPWRTGDACCLTQGPFAHMHAVVHALDDHTATLSLLMLGELRHVTVPFHAITPIKD